MNLFEEIAALKSTVPIDVDPEGILHDGAIVSVRHPGIAILVKPLS